MAALPRAVKRAAPRFWVVAGLIGFLLTPTGGGAQDIPDEESRDSGRSRETTESRDGSSSKDPDGSSSKDPPKDRAPTPAPDDAAGTGTGVKIAPEAGPFQAESEEPGPPRPGQKTTARESETAAADEKPNAATAEQQTSVAAGTEPNAATAEQETSVAAETEEPNAAMAGQQTSVAAETEEPSAAMAAMGAAAPTGQTTGKRWQLFATLSQSVSSGVFSASTEARQVSYGYAVFLSGLYRLMPLGDGTLEAFGQMSIDQELTPNFNSTGTREREFFFRDITLGALTRGFYVEPVTQIIFGAATTIELPTSKTSRARDRIFRWNLSVNATRIFTEVGPGTLVVRISEAFRKDVGPALGAIDDERFDCRQRIVVTGGAGGSTGGDQGTCLGVLNSNYGLIHGLSASYIWGNLTFRIAFQLFNIWDINASDSSTDGLDFEVGRSPYANDTAFNASTFGTVSVNYALNRNLNFTLGTSTIQEQYGKDQDGAGWHVRFPFWDTETTGNGNSSIFFAVNAIY